MINTTPHISSELERSLSEIAQDVLTIASRSRSALAEATKGFLERDNEICNAVIANDDIIDELDDSINRRAMEVLLIFRPVAVDMRTTLASMRLGSAFERIGDESVTIARLALRLNLAKKHPDAESLEGLMVKTRRHFEDSLISFTEKDVALARQSISDSKQLHRQIEESINQQGLSLNHPEKNDPQVVIDLLMILRSISNILNYSEDVCNEMIFLSEDIHEQIKH